jgi:hypothetical protein
MIYMGQRAVGCAPNIAVRGGGSNPPSWHHSQGKGAGEC